MAVQRVLTAKINFVGDGAATTYALNTSTGCYELCGAGGQPLPVALSVAIAATATGVTPNSGITAVSKIPYTVAFATNTATITFATAPPAGVKDYLTLDLIVP